jgi:hypothetical protein
VVVSKIANSELDQTDCILFFENQLQTIKPMPMQMRMQMLSNLITHAQLGRHEFSMCKIRSGGIITAFLCPPSDDFPGSLGEADAPEQPFVPVAAVASGARAAVVPRFLLDPTVAARGVGGR